MHQMVTRVPKEHVPHARYWQLARQNNILRSEHAKARRHGHTYSIQMMCGIASCGRTLLCFAHRLQLHRNLRYSNGIDSLATDTEGLLFDTEVVAGPDICNNFVHALVGKVT